MPRPAAKKRAPSTAIIDSQSVRTAGQSEVRGCDAGQKITGKKRNVLIDTTILPQGLVKPEIVNYSDDVKGLTVLSEQWIVEPKVGWLIHSRRLIRDLEVEIEHLEAMI